MKKQWLSWLAVASSALMVVNLNAQTAEQLEAFKKLPKAQQQALASQYGVDLNALKAGPTQEAITNPEVVIPKSENDELTLKQDEEKPDVIEAKFSKNSEEQLDNKQENRQQKLEISLFGYELFDGVPTTFAPATDIPVPSEYIVGPGDEIKLHLYGKTNEQLTLVVDRSGIITLPNIGPVNVAGLSFNELKMFIDQQIKERAIGLNVITTMGQLRSIRIFILGEANRPGSYTVSALSTMTNALFVSGGIKKTGSLRNIQLKRNGQLVSTIDLYDLLLNGDTSADVRLLPGDVLFVPPIGKIVGIGGEVKRSAFFELKNEQTMADVIGLSGGFLPTAYLPVSKVNRIDHAGQRTVIDVDFSNQTTLQQTVRDGDVVQIFSILDGLEDIVTLEGHIYRPGNYAYKSGLAVGDLINNIKDAMPNVDLDYALIRREDKTTREISFKQFSLRNVLAGEQVSLKPRDKVYFFPAVGSRADLLENDIAILKRQTTLGAPANIVTVNGAVRADGSYPFIEGMTVSSLLKAGANFTLETDREYAVLVRVDAKRHLQTVSLNLKQQDALAITLQPEDNLYVFNNNQDRAESLEPVIAQLTAQISKDVEDVLVTINGEVRFPGIYPYSSDMTLADLVAAAGGLTESAYMVDAVLTRFSTNGSSSADYQTLIIDLARDTKINDYSLKAKDVVLIKRIPDWREAQFIELKGEVVFPGKYMFQAGETLSDVINRAGGFTDKAFPGGAVFLRPSTAEQQRRLLRELEKRISKDLSIAYASKSMTSTTANPTMGGIPDFSKLVSLVGDVEDKGLGRVSIDLLDQLASSDNAIQLEDGDQLIVPRKPSTITVIGEVQMSTAQVFSRNMTVDQYIEQAGGVTQYADEGRIYIVRADGRIYMPGTSMFTFGDGELQPGDTIVVPLNSSLRDGFALWQQITQIVYNSSVALAALLTL